MKVDITNKLNNTALNRREIKLNISECSATPARAEIRKKVASLLSADENLVVIEEINNSYGKKEFNAKANIYADKETMNKIEQKHLIKRNFGEEKKEQTEEAPPAPPAKETGQKEEKAAEIKEEAKTEAEKKAEDIKEKVEEKKEEAKETKEEKPAEEAKPENKKTEA